MLIKLMLTLNTLCESKFPFILMNINSSIKFIMKVTCNAFKVKLIKSLFVPWKLNP